MSKPLKAISDSGPLIHLKEINALNALKIFELYSPVAVQEETKGLAEKECKVVAVKNKTIARATDTIKLRKVISLFIFI